MPALPESLTLRDGDIVLRDWRKDDAPALEGVCGEAEVCEFTSVPWTYTPSAASAWVRRQHAHRAAGTGLALAIARVDGPALGNVNLVRFSDDSRDAALGYWLVPAVRGQGFAVTAARMLCEWGFEHLKLARIELAVLPGNVASHRVAEGLGASHEGRRLNRPEPGGRAWEMVIYSLCGPSRR